MHFHLFNEIRTVKRCELASGQFFANLRAPSCVTTIPLHREESVQTLCVSLGGGTRIRRGQRKLECAVVCVEAGGAVGSGGFG